MFTLLFVGLGAVLVWAGHRRESRSLAPVVGNIEHGNERRSLWDMN
jgi:hypothetical protein